MSGEFRFRLPLAVIALSGVFVSILSYIDRGPGAFCELSEFVSCSAIYLSPYSKPMGVDLSIASTLFFSVLFASIILRYRMLSMALTILAIPIVASLIYVEFFILSALCIYCTFLQLFIFVSAALLILGYLLGG